MEQPATNKIIHVATANLKGEGKVYLILRKLSPTQFEWFVETSNGEQPSGVLGTNVEEALKAAQDKWKYNAFRTVICGFRYTLPERDEHGNNALFHQMAASFATPTGVYFDEDLGHNCVVHNASQEAVSLLRRLK